MINLKNEKGSITLFVLVSCMFFIASIVCVQAYMNSKQVSVDREYRQVKSNYEGDTLSEENLKETYNKISNLKNGAINIVKSTVTNGKLYVEFNLNSSDININSIKYGWGTSENVETVSTWNYIEKTDTQENMVAINNETNEAGQYNLFVMVNKQVIYSKIEL